MLRYGARLLLCATLVTANAHSTQKTEPAGRSYQLSWLAPPGCPQQSELVARIDRLLAGSPVETPAELVALARVTAAPDGGFEASLDYAIGGAKNQRTLTAPSCETLASATALIVATAIDPMAAKRASELGRQTSEPVSAPAETRAHAPKASTPAEASLPFARKPQALSPLSWTVAALSWGGVNVMPHLAWGAGVSLAVERRRLSAGIDVQYWGKQRQASDPRPDAGADFQRYSAGLRGCYRFLGGRLRLDGCGGLELIRLHGRGYGVDEPSSGSQAWIAPFFGSSIAWQVRPWLHLVARSELSFPLLRHDFELGGIGLVYRLPPVGQRLGMGIALPF
ncbi:MAG TPA: hypothetical protein VJN18_19830 [Polyangiaceae bacterium]|nr:hypothetical protein [Polyangiaceae bacterium]